MPRMSNADRLVYVRDNYLAYTDKELSRMLSVSDKTIYADRKSLNLSRVKGRPRDKDKIANVLTLHCNGFGVGKIKTATGLERNSIYYIINSYLKPLERSVNTITLIIESKLNYS